MSTNDLQASSDLLFCPFCGGEAKEFTGEDAAPHRWTVECDSCGAHVGSDTRHKARAKWNRRAERTCRNASFDPECFRCSECGAEDYTSDSLTMWHEGGPVDICYCPVCGARIVEVSDE